MSIYLETDIDNMFNFLTSSIGGSWQENEIHAFYPNPKMSELEPLIQKAKNADIAYIYFSGHGFQDRQGKDQIVLNKEEYINVLDLANLTNRQITIIDACRSSIQSTSDENYTGLGGIIFPSSSYSSRHIYEQYLNTLQGGRILLNATESGTNAIDGGSKLGGLFSTALLEATKSLASSNTQDIFSIITVFEEAKNLVELTKKKQTPVIYSNSEQALNLPFAIRLNNSQAINIQHNQNIKTQEIIEGLLIGSLIGATVVIGGLAINELLKK